MESSKFTIESAFDIKNSVIACPCHLLSFQSSILQLTKLVIKMRGSHKIAPDDHTNITEHKRESTEFTFRRHDPRATTISNF